MKRSVIAVVAFSLLTPGLAMAQAPQKGPHNDRRIESRHEQPRHGHQQRASKPQPRQQQPHWRKGQRVPDQYRKQRVDYRRHGLKAPPRGQEWVRAGNHYALINATTGLIMALSAIR